MIQFALEAFAAAKLVARSYVVIAPDDSHFDRVEELQGLATGLRVGGATRHRSVLNGLEEIDAGEDDWILVHDAARPGLDAELIGRLIGAVGDDEVGGLLAIPVADTLKEAWAMHDGHGSAARVVRTVPRAGLWQAQTPQMFRCGLLRRALRTAIERGTQVTDEASAVEALGLKPLLVPGSLRNFKVTHADDLDLAEKLLGAP